MVPSNEERPLLGAACRASVPASCKLDRAGSGGAEAGMPLVAVPRATCILQEGGHSASGLRITRKLLIACCLSATFMVVEIIGGYFAGSVAVMADAAHMFSDVLAFVVSAYCTHMVAKRASASYSFGYHRAETVGALISILIVCVITGALVLEAAQRLLRPVPIDGRLMFIIAVVGIGFNVLLLLTLGHGHHHHGGHDHGHTHDGHCHSSHAEASRGTGTQVAPAAVQHGPGRQRVGGVEPPSSEVVEVPEAAESASSGSHHELEGGQQGAGIVSVMLCGVEPHDGFSAVREPCRERELVDSAPCGHSHGHGHGHSHGHSHTEHNHDNGGHSHDHSNQNMRGAVLHVIGDLLQSIGVALAGLIIWLTNGDSRWLWVDPVCTFIFAVSVVWVTKSLIVDVLNDLMEAAPAGIDLHVLLQQLEADDAVASVHDMHVWTVGTGKHILTAHVDAVDDSHPYDLVQRLENIICAHGIDHSTVQICSGKVNVG